MISISVLLGGALYFTYSAKMDAEADLEKQKNAASREKARADRLQTTLEKAVPWFVASGEGGIAGEELSAASQQVAEAIKRELLTSVTDALPAETRISPDTATQHLQKQGPGYSILKVVENLKKRVQTLEAEAKTQKDLLKKEQQEAEHVRREAAAQKTTFQEQIDQLSRDRRRAMDEAAQAVQEKNSRVDELQKDLDYERESRVNDRKESERVVANLQWGIDRLRREVARYKQGGEVGGTSVRVEEDGRVIDFDPDSDMVVLDIGGRERVRPGMRFDIYWREKGGMPDWKGKVEVIHVDGKVGISQARVIREPEFVRSGNRLVEKTYNPDDPITPGCIAANPYFNPKLRSSFALVGEFEHHTTDELKKLLTAEGASEVVDDVAHATFVVLGKPPKITDSGYARYENQREEIRIRKLEVMSEEEVTGYLRNYRQNDEIAVFSSPKKR